MHEPSRDLPAGDVEAGELVPASGERVALAENEDGEAIVQPAKLLRIAAMLRNLQLSCHDVSLDDAGRRQLAEIQNKAVAALEDVLSEELHDELVSIFPSVGEQPTEGEVRVAQAQLVGWLEGLFQGIQASIAAQQATMQQQLSQMRAARSQEGQGAGNYGTYL